MLGDKKIIGLICECNPLHAGHKLIIKEARKKGNVLIAVMSGNFVQRGEPAVYDKYKRAKNLLKNGADIVIELPVEYCLSSAKYFARAGVSILNSLGIVDNIIFGSEINDIDKLNEIANIDTSKQANMKSNTNIKYANSIPSLLKSGMSYPEVLEQIYKIKLSPNDILAVEYIRALNELHSKIIPISIKRNNKLKSATELRKNIKKNITNDSFSDILNYKLIVEKSILNANNKFKINDSIINTYCMTDDIYHALMNYTNYNQSFDKLSQSLNTKNRTLANIKRILLNIVLGINNDITKKSKLGLKTNYIRILGMRESAMPILKNINVPYLLNFSPSSYKSMIKNFPSCKEVIINKKGEFVLSDSIKLNIFASNLYYNLANLNLCESRVDFLKLAD